MRGLVPAALLALLLLLPGVAQADSMSPDLTPYARVSDLAAALAGIPNAAQIGAAAPVQSVVGRTGAVTFPVFCRQASTAVAVSTVDGSASWTFPNTSCAFAAPPTCFSSLTATATNFTFDVPVGPPPTLTGVSLVVTAHPKTVTVGVSLPVVLAITPAGAPAGTTITFSCFAPM